MKNLAALILSIAILIGAGFGFSSCKEDEPPIPPKLSFADSEMTVSEAVGIVEVELVLDKPYGKNLNVDYDLGGTASDQDAVGTANADYEVLGTHGLVVIQSGETSAVIKLEIYNDTKFEEDETIEISIMDVNTSDVQVTADNEIVITITNDDAQAVASFVNTTMTLNEADGADGPIGITVQLDNPASGNMIVEYTLDGTALDSLFASKEEIPPSYYDYYIDGEVSYADGVVSGELVIPNGQTSADIMIQLFSDFRFEDDETIEITLTPSGSTDVGTNSTITITVTQEDGKLIGLLWEPSYTDVDMDMFLWVGADLDNLDGVLATALTPRTTPQEELIFIPTTISSGITEAAFGLSYVYYEGTADPMNFEVHFIDLIAGEFEIADERDVFAATYTAANINAWDQQSGNDPLIIQTFRIVDGQYVDLTDITVPATGSRMKGQKVPLGLKKREWVPATRLPL